MQETKIPKFEKKPITLPEVFVHELNASLGAYSQILRRKIYYTLVGDIEKEFGIKLTEEQIQEMSHNYTNDYWDIYWKKIWNPLMLRLIELPLQMDGAKMIEHYKSVLNDPETAEEYRKGIESLLFDFK